MTYRSLIVAAAVTLASSSAHAQATYKREIPDSLAKDAKITEAAAAATARHRVPKGTIDGVELEREKGKLIFSYDIKTPGKSGIDEVNVDAISGKIVGFEHESSATEKKEAAAEAKAKDAPKAAPKKP
jgi:uncharacterized membrane protein YkoI